MSIKNAFLKASTECAVAVAILSLGTIMEPGYQIASNPTPAIIGAVCMQYIGLFVLANSGVRK